MDSLYLVSYQLHLSAVRFIPWPCFYKHRMVGLMLACSNVLHCRTSVYCFLLGQNLLSHRSNGHFSLRTTPEWNTAWIAVNCVLCSRRLPVSINTLHRLRHKRCETSPIDNLWREHTWRLSLHVLLCYICNSQRNLKIITYSSYSTQIKRLEAEWRIILGRICCIKYFFCKHHLQ